MMKIRDGLDPAICAFLIRHGPAVTTMQINKKQTQFTTTHNATHTTSKLAVMVGQSKSETKMSKISQKQHNDLMSCAVEAYCIKL
jgi:hypothetical protein